MIRVGDTVLHKGRNGVPVRAKITAIDLCARPGMKYGTPVEYIDEKWLRYCCFSLDNGHWSFETEVTLIEQENREAA